MITKRKLFDHCAKYIEWKDGEQDILRQTHTHSGHTHRGLFLLVESSDTGGGVVVPKLTEKVGVTEKDFTDHLSIKKIHYELVCFHYPSVHMRSKDYCTWFVCVSVYLSH